MFYVNKCELINFIQNFKKTYFMGFFGICHLFTRYTTNTTIYKNINKKERKKI
jgi:hypothetical protein